MNRRLRLMAWLLGLAVGVRVGLLAGGGELFAFDALVLAVLLGGSAVVLLAQP
jgi:hypothetical protein